MDDETAAPSFFSSSSPPSAPPPPPANAHPIVEDAIRFIVTIVIGVIPVNERVQERDVPPRTHVRA